MSALFINAPINTNYICPDFDGERARKLVKSAEEQRVQYSD
jgi:hypothetical protein